MLRILLLFLAIINFYLFYDLISPPYIKIYSPKEKITYQSEILIKGKVDDRASLFLNDARIYPQKNGYFEKKIYLKPGLNKLLFRAIKFWGQKKEKEILIFYQPPPK
jgi:hypothetical protein